MSFRIAVTQELLASRKVNPATPPCQPDPNKCKPKPHLHHLTTIKPLRRHLLFHENLTTSKVGEGEGEEKVSDGGRGDVG